MYWCQTCVCGTSGSCGNTTHTLHNVEHCALNLQERLNAACYDKGYIAGLNVCAVFDVGCHLQLGVEVVDYLASNVYTCQDAFFLDEQFLFAHFGVGNTA